MKKYDDGISVIVPVYNVEQYIRKCLDSIINQLYTNLEIICVIDKKSSDSSEQIVEEYAAKDDRIKILHDTTGLGLGYNRNLGMEIVSKSYIGFIDSDDYIDEDFYLRLYENALSHDADVVMTETQLIDTKTNSPKEEVKYQYRVEYSLDKMYKIIRYSTCWNKIYRTSFLKKYNIDFPDSVIHEDNPFTLKVLHKCNKLVIVPGSFYHWVRNPDSLCFNPSLGEKRLNDAKIVFEMVLDYLKQADIPVEVKSDIIEFNITRYAVTALFNEKYSKDLALKINEVIDVEGGFQFHLKDNKIGQVH